MPIRPGTKLGQYEVQEFIGQGAMGLVYRAYHSQLERTGAVKVLQAMTPDADTVARFRHEAQAIAKFRHPNIVDVYDFGEFEGTPYMIVEYIPGGSLSGKMARGMLDQDTAIRYLRGIAAGLDYAHNKGVVHRDVKPANVLLTAEDTPVLADFGLAKLMQGSSLKSMTGVTTGTPAYMAPEQVTGSRVGPAADRYSLATIAYEMLTGVIPFDGEALMELLYAQVHREPLAPSARNHSLGPRVDATIMRGLAKDPAARWATASELVESLASALKPAPVGAVAATLVMAPQVASTVPLSAAAVMTEPVQEETATPPFTTAYPSPPSKPPRVGPRRSTIALIALGVILVLLAATLIGLSFLTNKAVSVSVSPDTVTAGDTVVVRASHLPANQQGDVELWSDIARRVAFRADADGNVSITLDVPRDLVPGAHLIKVCWAGTCRASQTVNVNAAPVPSPSPAPSATPSGSPASAPLVEVLQPSVKPGGSESVGGRYFPGTTVAVYFVQGTTVIGLGTAQVSGGRFVTTVRIPSTAKTGSAAIRVCYTGGCAFATISVG
ncbi:MAG TPA: protein kinase [Candidatus Dormibacteraeota bacterium]|nr:protein kinase [Candidatus Dormibacteraeota bacterium]